MALNVGFHLYGLQIGTISLSSRLEYGILMGTSAVLCTVSFNIVSISILCFAFE